MKKLISMTDYVLHKNRVKEDSDTAIFKVTNYANFLKQPLELWMFVPCDENGNVSEIPKAIHGDIGNIIYRNLFNKYRQAKKRCLFDGFDLRDYNLLMIQKLKTIEDLIPYKLTIINNETN
jgi:hypothetical protein